jgi:hypothetical protein
LEVGYLRFAQILEEYPFLFLRSSGFNGGGKNVRPGVIYLEKGEKYIGKFKHNIFMVKKKTFLLSLIFAVLIVSMIHTNYLADYDYSGSLVVTTSEFTRSFGEIGSEAFYFGVLIEYVVFLVVIYLFLRGIVNRFEK